MDEQELNPMTGQPLQSAEKGFIASITEGYSQGVAMSEKLFGSSNVGVSKEGSDFSLLNFGKSQKTAGLEK